MNNNARGFSLIEAMVVVAIMTTTMLTMATIFTRQVSDQKRIQQKSEINDLKNNLALILGNPNTCACQFTGQIFQAQNTTSAPYGSLNVPAVSSACPGANVPVAVAANSLVPGTQTNLKTATVQLQSIQYISSNQYKANFMVAFDPSSSVTIYQPLLVPMTITTTGAANSGPQTIAGCGGTVVTAASVCAELGGTYDPVALKCTGAGGGGAVCDGQTAPAYVSTYNDYYSQNTGYNCFTCQNTPVPYVCTPQGWQCLNGYSLYSGSSACAQQPQGDDDGG